MIGQTISHYRITAKLGEGGMGVVYRATDLSLDRQVAVKVLPSRLSDVAEARTRMLREAKAASALEHPNICSVFEIGTTEDGQMFMVMPCYEGESLHDRLERGPLPVDQAIEIGRQIGSALSVTHAKGILHRDIKPANVMLTNDGTQAVLMDFGLAKPDDATQITRTGAAVGTIAYMSPEQLRGEEVDARSDQWSLGVMLYEMVTGRRPFDGPTEAAVLNNVLHSSPGSARQLAPMPVRVDALLERMLDRDPAHRVTSVDEVVHELTLAMEGDAGSKLLKLRSHRRRRSALLTLLVIVVLLSVAGRIFLERDARGGIESLAVLPLENLSSDESEAFFAAGMTDQLISSLMNISSIRVISHRSVRRYATTDKSLPEIADELGVDAILEGSVSRFDDRVRISARLLDGRHEQQLWSDTIERSMTDVLSLQSGIARSIATAIRVTLSAEDEERLRGSRTVDPEAYQAYLLGRYWWNHDLSGFEKSLPYFERAAELDPDFVLAHVGIADVYVTLSCHALASPMEVRGKARAAIDRALALDAERSEVLTTLGHYLIELEWDLAGAEEAFLRAIEINPSCATAHHFYGSGLLLNQFHDTNRALERLRTARSLDPLSPNVSADLAMVLTEMRRFEESWTILSETIQRFPDWDPSADLTYWYLAQGRLEDAVRKVPNPMELVEIAYYRSVERPDSAAMIRNEFERRAARTYVAPTTRARVAAAAGDFDEAFRWLEIALSERDPRIIRLPDPDDDASRAAQFWRPLMTDPRYPDFVAKVRGST